MVSGLCENQTLQNLALARLWALGSARLWAELHRLWAPLGSARLWAELRRLWARGAGAPEQPASGFWTLQTLQNLALARLWALGSARLWAELRRLWARGSGAPNPFFLVARNCPSNASNPSNPSNAPTLANGCAIRLDSGRFRRSMDASDAPKPRTCSVVSGLCENQTLQNLALARLWALGSARLWAELRRLWARGAGEGSSQPLDSGRFRRSKTSHLPDCGLWALRDCGRSCASCGLGALARQILFF